MNDSARTAWLNAAIAADSGRPRHTHCRNGHLITVDRHTGKRRCRTCHLAAQRARPDRRAQR